MTMFKKLKKNLDNARAKMQKNYEDRVNTISEETRNTISEKSKLYNDALSSERERFMQDRARTNTDFSKRMTDLSKSFKDAQDAKDRSHAESMNSAKKERYREGLDQKQKEFNDKVAQFQNESKKG